MTRRTPGRTGLICAHRRVVSPHPIAVVTDESCGGHVIDLSDAKKVGGGYPRPGCDALLVGQPDQTHKHEIGGGYLWSPMRSSNGARNQFYENMKAVAPGDVVFCYWKTAVRAWGVARSYGYDSPRPEEFGVAGERWSTSGYRVDVQYTQVASPLFPRRHWAIVKPLLPSKYSPLHPDTGKGGQNLYLAAVPEELGELLVGLISQAGDRAPYEGIPTPGAVESREYRIHKEWEAHLEGLLVSDSSIGPTEREALVSARVGQGVFRENVIRSEGRCRVTGIEDENYLIASHIKPWRHCDNAERLDGNNGLLLAPHADFVFDRGFITFQADGTLVASEVANRSALNALGIEVGSSVGPFSDKQEHYLEHHRAEIFRSAG